MPGEVTRQVLRFLTRTTLVVSPANPGATDLAQQMIERHPDLRAEPPQDPSAQGVSGAFDDALLRSLSFSRSFERRQIQRRLAQAQRRRDSRRRVFLLYLNKQTFLGEQGNELAKQVHFPELSLPPSLHLRAVSLDLGLRCVRRARLA